MVAENSRISEWIARTLNDDEYLQGWADGGIWVDYAPQDTTGNIVLAAWQGGSDRKIAFAYSLYLIRAVAEGGQYDLVEQAADRIDERMTTTIPIDGLDYRDIHLARVERDSPHQRKDAENGIPVVYLGKVYRIWYARPIL
jgi:hypothetical protein